MYRFSKDRELLLLLACAGSLFWGCANQAVSGWEAIDAGPSVMHPDAGGGGPLPPIRDGGSTDSGGLPPQSDAGPPLTPPGNNDAGTPPSPNSCMIWSDCGPFYGDPNSGYSCENSQCVCDPSGNAQQNCTSSGGNFLFTSCYCQRNDGPDEPPDIGGSCTSWEDCAPHYGDQNSGFECISQNCTCDPQRSYAPRCAEYGGFWVEAECFCAFADQAPPGEASEDCYWTWNAPPCDPERWVDTSHYECEYDHRNELRCDVWVQSGYWEPGACPSGTWEEVCY